MSAPIIAGVVADTPCVIGTSEIALVTFQISRDVLRETDMMDAAGATPGRYVGEMLRRLRQMHPGGRRYLAFNPQLGIPPLGLQAVLSVVNHLDPEVSNFAIFTEATTGRPLAYLLRADLVDRCPPVHLGLLTCWDAALDRRLLQASFGPGAGISAGAVSEVTEVANGFLAPPRPAIAKIALRAAELLEREPTEEARRALVQHGERTALVAFHAGDLLFVLQGLTLEETAFRSIVVPTDYADIVRYLRPDLEVLVVPLPVPQRGAYMVVDEQALLHDYITLLESRGVHTRRFFHILRPFFRDYNATRHSLRESAAFAAGGAGHRLRPTPPMSLASSRDYRLTQPLPGRVVIQFDAGWLLKGFPADRRGELVDLLRARGYDPVLLGDREPACPDVPAVPYTNLAALRVLLGSAVAFIGCDSFPSHFAEAYGVPTLILFGSTQPENARGRETPRYRYLHHPMSCVPCRQSTYCKLDQGQSCHAQPSAAEVVAALSTLSLAEPRPMGPPEEAAALALALRPASPRASATAADHYLSDYVSAGAHVAELARRLPPGGAVLTLSCGLGALARRLTEAGYRAVGVEPDPSLLRLARVVSGAPVFGSLDEVAKGGARFDVVSVLAGDEARLAPAEGDLTAAVRDVLTPGGVLVQLTDPLSNEDRHV